MVDTIYTTEAAELGGGLSIEESNLLSTAYQKAVSTRQASWRIISLIKQKEEFKGPEKHVGTVHNYLHKIEAELRKLCQDILSALDEFLTPKAESVDLKVFYHEKRGYYRRYLAEFP